MQPDIIVLAPDRPDFALVAEIKQLSSNTDAIEAELQDFMLGNRCSVGLLVTPSKTWIYQDSFRDQSRASIRKVGELDTNEILGLKGSPTEFELFHAVRDWLERLATAWFAALPAAGGARESIIQYLVPVLSEGRILAGKW
jgi:hypothetical protein